MTGDDDEEETDVECPECGSVNLESFDGTFYDDDELLGFKYQCNECGVSFYSGGGTPEWEDHEPPTMKEMYPLELGDINPLDDIPF